MSVIDNIIHKGRMIKKVGLDTDVIIALIDDLNQFSMFKPKIFNRNNAIFINYRVFSELMGHLINNRNFSNEESVNKIFSYLRENRILLLKKSNTDIVKLNEIIEGLRKQRDVQKNLAGDKDLEIISIYKFHKMDLIFSRNSGHFEPFCKYLGITFMKLQDNVDVMWKQAFGWKYRRKIKYNKR